MPWSRLLRAAALGGAVALLITACSPRPTIMTDDGILAAETVLSRAGEVTDSTSAALIYYLESEEQSAAPQRQLRLPLKSDVGADPPPSER